MLGGTSNEAERALRNPALARKTVPGARRQTMVASVLESLRLYLANVIEEAKGWMVAGRSCFEQLLEKLGLPLPTRSILDEILPDPSG